jgi:hypothetical protein
MHKRVAPNTHDSCRSLLPHTKLSTLPQKVTPSSCLKTVIYSTDCDTIARRVLFIVVTKWIACSRRAEVLGLFSQNSLVSPRTNGFRRTDLKLPSGWEDGRPFILHLTHRTRRCR